MLLALQFSIFQKQPLEFCSVLVLLEKALLEILQNSQESTCSKVSFLTKLQAEVTASDLSCVFSSRFFVHSISTEKWNEKRKIPRWSSNIYFFCEYWFVWHLKISKEIWEMVIWSEKVFKEKLLLFSWLVEFH